VATDVGAAVARRALGLVGVPFKLGGRCPRAGLDCVGVVEQALADHAAKHRIPAGYTLRGEYLERITAFFDCADFRRLTQENPAPGDIFLCQPAVHQFHLAIVTENGAVHAHAGLRRVVLTPLDLPWPVIGHWRLVGD
jgi:cell wall-associated NlpC family hydrolase